MSYSAGCPLRHPPMGPRRHPRLRRNDVNVVWNTLPSAEISRGGDGVAGFGLMNDVRRGSMADNSLVRSSTMNLPSLPGDGEGELRGRLRKASHALRYPKPLPYYVKPFYVLSPKDIRGLVNAARSACHARASAARSAITCFSSSVGVRRKISPLRPRELVNTTSASGNS